MVTYETLMLVRTEITDDELKALERHFDKIVASQKGRITLFDRWGKYKLAYPVQKNIYGIYILSRCQIPKGFVSVLFKEIDALFRIKYNELVMRHVTVRLEEGASSVYKYPEPIGSRGTSDLGSFIKEHKMEGLIDTPVNKKTEGGAGEEKEIPLSSSDEKEESSVEQEKIEPVVDSEET